MTILPYDRSRLHAMLVALDQQAERDLRRHLLHARYDTAVLMRAENRSRRVLQALDYAKDPALKRLRLQFSQVDIATNHPEFSRWEWCAPDLLVPRIVPFKRAVYEQVLTQFGPLI